MGQVYEVEHIGLGVHYALKTFVFSNVDDEEAESGNRTTELLRTKFLEEGQMLARLKHQHLIRVFDLAIDEETRAPYYVMDLVLYKDGNPYTLDDVDREGLDEDFIFAWYKDACDALDYVHSLGVVHRDIKLENLLLTADKHVMLSDFGIAHIFGDGLVKNNTAETTQVDSQGNRTVLYTPRYVAPEVEAGYAPTPEADAYSLGVAIFKLLTGVWYEQGSDALELLRGRKYRWGAVLPRLLAPAPGGRPKNLSETVEMLESVGARVPRARRKRKEGLVIGVAFVVGTLIALSIIGGAYWYLDRSETAVEASAPIEAQPSAREKELERENAEKQRQLKEAQNLNERYERELKERELKEREEKKREEQERLEKQRRENERIAAEQRQREEAERRAALPAKAAESNQKPSAAVDGDNRIKPASAKKYTWYGAGGNLPREVVFELLNGARVKLLPLKDGEKRFWISHLPISVSAWRDFKSDAFPEWQQLEKAIPTPYELCAAFNADEVKAYCEYLTAKYRLSLPKDHGFRPATDGEIVAAYAEKETRLRCERTGRELESCVGFASAVRATRFRTLSASLAKFSEWNAYGVSKDGKLLIAGLAMPHASGVCDLAPLNSSPAWPHLVLAPAPPPK